MSERWALVRDGLVRAYFIGNAAPSIAERRRITWGDGGADRPDADLAAEGEWIACPAGQLVGDGWTYVGGTFSPPLLPPPRVPGSVPRGAARIIMAAAIYPAGHPQAGKSVLRRVKELLAAAEAATAALPDADPQRIAAVVTREAFEGEGEFLRHGATTLRLAQLAEVDAAWMDALFQAAEARAQA